MMICYDSLHLKIIFSNFFGSIVLKDSQQHKVPFNCLLLLINFSIASNALDLMNWKISQYKDHSKLVVDPKRNIWYFHERVYMNTQLYKVENTSCKATQLFLGVGGAGALGGGGREW